MFTINLGSKFKNSLGGEKRVMKLERKKKYSYFSNDALQILFITSTFSWSSAYRIRAHCRNSIIE